MTVDELLQAIRDSGVRGDAKVVIGREPARISQRAADMGEIALVGKHAVTGVSESVDGDALAILYDAERAP